MAEIDLASCDLTSANGRHATLQRIPATREAAKEYHTQLLDIFAREMDFRRKLERGEPTGGDDDSYEQLYHCGLLLFLAGDPVAVPLMWKAKQLSMDTACAFDAQFLVGAGVAETIRYCESNEEMEIAEYLKGMNTQRVFDNLQRWEEFRIRYYYGTNP